MASDPTPPPPPGMKTLLPSVTPPRRRAWSDVRPARGMEAASEKEMLDGFLAISSVVQTTYSAMAPYFIPARRTNTSSPTEYDVEASSPASSMVPATSYPKTLSLYFSGLSRARSPPRRILSMGLRAQAWTLMRTSLGDSMNGLGIVFTERASGVLPKAVKQTAFMVAPSGCAGMLGLTMVGLVVMSLLCLGKEIVQCNFSTPC
mmetsp:Transcript_66/g.77  ORF Transcript_66/g.77 Transcript_66/m.77 type:complete len:204 (-) Transcript_66:14-625(-)